MQTNTDRPPATAHHDADPGTGAGAQATTAEREAAYRTASYELLNANLSRAMAEAQEHYARAKVHRVAPGGSRSDRETLAMLAEVDAQDALGLAEQYRQRLCMMEAEYPELTAEPYAAITVVVHRDTIEQRVKLSLGGAKVIARKFQRASARLWRTTDPAWNAHEDRIGVELVEYMDAMDMPDRVADMLPRPSTRTAAEVKAVQHG